MLIARYDEKYQREQTLENHCRNVSVMAGEGLRPFGLAALGEILGWLHDCCKAACEWQEAIQSQRRLYFETEGQAKRQPAGVPHAPPAAQLVFRLFSPLCHDPVDQLTLQILCMVIYAHHGYLMDALSLDGRNIYEEKICAASEAQTEEADSFFSEIISKDRLHLLWKDAREEIAGHLETIKSSCEFLSGAHEERLTEYRNFMLGMLIRLAYSVLIDADRLDAANFEAGILDPTFDVAGVDWHRLSSSLDNKLSRFNAATPINKMRGKISLACLEASRWEDRLQKLHAPTGGGKTLASLRWALGCMLKPLEREERKKIFYVVSYTTILDQVYGDYTELFKNIDGLNILLHHSNIIPDEEVPSDHRILYQNAEKRQLLLAERWDADIILTTQVQLFNALFLGTGKAARRMKALHDAVIIFDEVQTIPVHLTYLFNLAIAWLTEVCRCKVLLSTATQPTLDLLEYPLPPARNVIENPDALFLQMKRVTIHDERKRGPMDARVLAEFVLAKQKENISVLVVVNTRSVARKVYDALVMLEPGGVELYLLSNNMCVAHRKAIIEKLKDAQNHPSICVSTQLIECGVDLSFGCAVRSLAGADNIWQTAGRCNRHGNPENELKPVYIINCSEENLRQLKDIERAQGACERTLHHAKEADRLQLPETISQYYRRYYQEQKYYLSHPIDGGADRLWQGTTILDMLCLNRKGNTVYNENTNSKPNMPLRQAFHTAGQLFAVIDNQSIGVIVPYGHGACIIEELNAAPSLEQEKKLLKEAQLYTVNLFRNHLEALGEGAVYKLSCGALALRKEWYDCRKKGLLTEPVCNTDDYMV